MAKRIDHISGRVKVREASQLDSSRFDYLSLDQAEPNFGQPDSNGALVVSSASGRRSFTDQPLLGGISFKVNALDSADSASLFALFIKGSPFDNNVDSIGFRRLDGSLFETDTLDTVVQRGNVTSRPVQVGALIVDSAGIIGGPLQVNDAAVIDSSLSLGGKLFIGDVREERQTLSLFLDETTGEVTAAAGVTAIDSAASEIRVVSVDSNNEYHPTFVGTLNGIDSVNVDSDFTYNPDLNRLKLGRLRLTDIELTPFESIFLTVDSNGDIGFRGLIADSEGDTLQSVTSRGDSTDADLTVQSLTAVDSVSAGGDLQFGNRFLDGSGRRLVIYDSSGLVLWG